MHQTTMPQGGLFFNLSKKQAPVSSWQLYPYRIMQETTSSTRLEKKSKKFWLCQQCKTEFQLIQNRVSSASSWLIWVDHIQHANLFKLSYIFLLSGKKNPIKYFLRFLVLQNFHVVILELEELFFPSNLYFIIIFRQFTRTCNNTLELSFKQLTNFLFIYFLIH